MGSLLLGVLYAGLFLFDDDLLVGLKMMIAALMLIALFLCALIFVYLMCRHVQANRVKAAAGHAMSKIQLVASRMRRKASANKAGRSDEDEVYSNPLHSNSV